MLCSNSSVFWPIWPQDSRYQFLSLFVEDLEAFVRYLPGWGKSVVVGRGKLGGVPMGVIAVETRPRLSATSLEPSNRMVF